MNYVWGVGAVEGQKLVFHLRVAACPLTVNCGIRADLVVPATDFAQVGLRRTLCDIEPESHDGGRAVNMGGFGDYAGHVFHGPPDTMGMQGRMWL
jgi:hypothetical protein